MMAKAMEYTAAKTIHVPVRAPIVSHTGYLECAAVRTQLLLVLGAQYHKLVNKILAIPLCAMLILMPSVLWIIVPDVSLASFWARKMSLHHVIYR